MKKNVRIATLIVPVLMLLFLARNIVMVETDHMDSWMGGGMRMFGKVDKMLYRVSGMAVKHRGQEYFVNFRNVPELEDEDVALRILPNDNRLQGALERVKKMKWCYDASSNTVELANDDCSSSPKQNIEIQGIAVYRTNFDDENNEVSLKLINSYRP